MGKLSNAQKETLENLFDEGEYDPKEDSGLSFRTLQSLEGKGFVRYEQGVWFLTSFGANVVKVMRGQLGRRRR